ncbi:MAG: LacI family DNA-binding transcriptional regulator [Metallibacterium sp.]
MSTESQEASAELQQRLPARAPRLRDVARAAGVSPKTPSRVINNERSVRTEVREKVWAAVKSLRYVPHPSARSLAANRSFQIGLLYDNLSPGYVMEVQAGVLDACQARRYGAIVHPLRADASGYLREIIEPVSHHRLDGLLTPPPITDDAAIITWPRAPTAIFAANDDMAAGVLWATAQSGIEVPGRLSVCGFDDMPISRQVWPPLTTVRQPCRLMGQIAAQQLIEAIEKPGSGRMVVLPYELCTRGSTAPPGDSSRSG